MNCVFHDRWGIVRISYMGIINDNNNNNNSNNILLSYNIIPASRD